MWQQSGTYYVDVTNIFPDSGLDYTLSASVLVDDFAGDTSTTGVLEIGGTATGTLDFEFDSDWFAIELTAGETTFITLDQLDSDLILRDAAGNFMAFGDMDFGANETVLTTNVAQSGTYYVEVSSVFDFGVDYTLSATSSEDDFAGDTSTTGVLEIDGMATGTINFSDDRDWFAIELTAGELVRIASDGFDADISLRSETGSFVAFDRRDFSTGENVILTQVDQTGTFYIDVSSSDSSLSYTLSASIVVDDFADDTSTTGVLEIDGTATGILETEDDSDWFAIELTAGETALITVDLFDGNLVLRDASGAARGIW